MRQPRVVGIGILGCPVVHLVLKHRLVSEAGRTNRTEWYNILATYALEEGAKVKPLVGEPEIEAVLKERTAVTDHLEIAVIIHGVGSVVDLAVTIEILVLDVAGSEDEAT